jgi:hypothetical protein
MRDHFNLNATYPEKYFHRRFRVHMRIFLTIAEVGEKQDDWFKLRRSMRAHWWNVLRMFERFHMGVQSMLLMTMSTSGKIKSWRPSKDIHGLRLRSLDRITWGNPMRRTPHTLGWGWITRMAWDAWLGRLHALDLEELSYGMERLVQINATIKIGKLFLTPLNCRERSMDLEFILWIVFLP